MYLILFSQNSIFSLAKYAWEMCDSSVKINNQINQSICITYRCKSFRDPSKNAPCWVVPLS